MSVTVEYATDLLQKLNLDEDTASLSKIKRTMRKDGNTSFKCLMCPHSFDTHGELRRHISKRKHFIGKESIKTDRTEFEARVEGKERPQWSVAELETFLCMAVREGHLISFG